MQKLCVHSFIYGENSGSPQFLNFFSSKADARAAFLEAKIEDDYDHSFVFIDRDRNAHVYWKNRAGNIEFCGSGAYALAWCLFKTHPFKTNPVQQMKINSEKQILIATLTDDLVELYLPIAEVEEVSKNLFFSSSSGIYFLQLESLDEIFDSKKLERYFSDQTLPNIHGFCVFHWSAQTSQGHVRYFCPWHGRPEDSVTGSIHKSLSLLVSKLYGIQSMAWQQVSTRGGSIDSKIRNGEVIISGECLLVSS